MNFEFFSVVLQFYFLKGFKEVKFVIACVSVSVCTSLKKLQKMFGFELYKSSQHAYDLHTA